MRLIHVAVLLALVFGACAENDHVPLDRIRLGVAWAARFGATGPLPDIVLKASDCSDGDGFTADGECVGGMWVGWEQRIYLTDYGNAVSAENVCHEMAHAAHDYADHPDCVDGRGCHDHPDFAPGGRVEVCARSLQ